MAKNIFVGVNNVAKKPKNIYVGVNGVARKVKSAYIGVNGVARKVWPTSLLPTTYQRVEYIQSASGSSTNITELGYIETGYKPNNSTRIVAKFSRPGGLSSEYLGNVFHLQEYKDSAKNTQVFMTIQGALYSGDMLAPTFMFGANYTTDSFYQSSWYVSGNNAYNPYVYDLNNNRKLYFNNIVHSSQISTTINFDKSKSTIIIFGRKYVDINNNVEIIYKKNGSLSGTGIIRLYSFKIYSNYTSLARDYYPCYRISDGVAGLYDIITNTFISNAISGANFPVGSNVNE